MGCYDGLPIPPSMMFERYEKILQGYTRAIQANSDKISGLSKRIYEMEKAGMSEELIAREIAKYFAENPIEESDPTVPDWAKSESPPTAEEIGAIKEGDMRELSPEELEILWEEA